jgi:hypothetical protein
MKGPFLLDTRHYSLCLCSFLRLDDSIFYLKVQEQRAAQKKGRGALRCGLRLRNPQSGETILVNVALV